MISAVAGVMHEPPADPVAVWARAVTAQVQQQKEEEEAKRQHERLEAANEADRIGAERLRKVFSDWGIPCEVTAARQRIGPVSVYVWNSVNDGEDLRLIATFRGRGSYNYSLDTNGRNDFARDYAEEVAKHGSA